MMKKSVCAVLILVLLFGGMQVFAQDMWKPLFDLHIVQGDPDGNLRENDMLIRAEAAKLMSALLFDVADVLPKKTVFSDVPQEHWASGYIALMCQTGVLSGNGDGTFEPEENVTNEQMIKMIVCALGYQPQAEAVGGYPSGYLMTASRIGILEGVSANGADAAIRGNVFTMLENALNVPLMVQTGFGASIEYQILDGSNGTERKTILNKR